MTNPRAIARGNQIRAVLTKTVARRLQPGDTVPEVAVIARALHISPRQACTYLRRVLADAGVQTRMTSTGRGTMKVVTRAYSV